LAQLFLVAGLLTQAPDTALIFQAWRGVWRRPFDSSTAAFRAAADDARARGNRPALASAHVGLGFLASRKGGVVPALAHFDSAMRVGATEDPTIEPLIRCTRATVLSFGGLPGARAEARLGQLRAREARSQRAMGWCWYAEGAVALNQSTDPATVLALLDSAIAVQRAAGDDDWLGISLFTRGYLLQFTGELAEAKRDLGMARKVATANNNRFTLAFVHRFLGDIHLATSDWTSADAEYRAALTAFQFLGDGIGLRGIKRVMASAQLGAGRLESAEATLRESRAEAESAGMAEGVYSALLELATVRWLRGDYEGSRAETERAAAYGLKTGHQGWVRQLGYHRGFHALRLGQLVPAERYLRAWLRDTPPGLILPRYAARARLAEVLVRRGRVDAGYAELSEAMDQLDSLRAGLDDRALRTLVFQVHNAFDEPDLGLATIVAALVRAGRVEEAFGVSERRRARVLADRLLRDRLVEGGLASDPHSAAAVPRPSVEALKAATSPGNALVEFLAGRWGQPTVAFVITRHALSAIILPSLDSLAADAERLVALLASGESADGPAGRLGRAILDPVVRGLPPDITTLHIVPDGFLHRLPFDALMLENGRPLLERYVVTVVPSAAVAQALHQKPATNRSGGVLAFGDPRFAEESAPTDAVAQAVYREAFDSAGGLPRLRASAGEASTAVGYSPDGELRLRAAASEAFLKTVAHNRFQVIHFATHALVDEHSSARTALALAPGDGEDGFVGPGELAALSLGADLVVLSACRTAGGTVVEGEGIQGLTAPFLEGGARAVVATMWPVADQKAAELTADFYAALARGLPVGAALRAAKLARRAAGAGPGEWAAFTAIGDPLLTIPLRAPPPHWRIWLVIGGLLLTVGFLFASRALRAPSPSPVARPS
jgi:CHAT domain-containing protein/tetratricopeptide (TPR) repeat protein